MQERTESKEEDGKGGQQSTRILIYIIIVVVVLAAVSVMLMLLFSNDRSGGRSNSGQEPPGDETMIIKREGTETTADDGVRTAGSLAVLVETEPTTLSRLEAVMGKVNRDMKAEMHALTRTDFTELISKVEMTFSIDMHHGDPFKDKDPGLLGYSLSFVEGREFCMDKLEQHRGKPDKIKAGGGEVLRYRTNKRSLWRGFFVVVGEGDSFRLAWNSSGVRAPDFAVPERSEEETKELLEKITGMLEEGLSKEALESRFGKMAYEKGRIYDFFAAHATWMLEFDPEEMFLAQIYFEPPLPGKHLVEAFGVSSPVIVSTDVHMTSRVVADLKTMSMPVFHGYKIYMHVEKDGLEQTDIKWPASAVWRAGEIHITSLFIMKE